MEGTLFGLTADGDVFEWVDHWDSTERTWLRGWRALEGTLPQPTRT